MTDHKRTIAALLIGGFLSAAVGAQETTPEEECVGVRTHAGFALETASGKRLWEKPYFNEWMDSGSGITVAPRCRWLVVAGSSAYRYVWVVGADGHPRGHCATPGTPQAVAISHSGDRFVVGTAAGHLLFVNHRAKVLRDVSGVLFIVNGLAFSPDDSVVLTTSSFGTIGLFSRSGDTIWTRDGAEAIVTNDWERFLVVSRANHGVPWGSLELVTRDGRTLWESGSFLQPLAMILPDDSGFRISSAPDCAAYVSSYREAETDDCLQATVLDREGNVVADQRPADGVGR